MKRTFTYLTFLCTTLCSIASADQPKLTADEPIEFDVENKTVIARGNATLEHSGATLKADRVEFSREDLSAVAAGKVSVTRKATRVLADQLQYDFKQKSLKGNEFKAGRAPVYVSGKGFGGDISRLEIKDATVYYGEPDAFSPNVKIRKGILINEDDHAAPEAVEGRDMIFRIGKVPLFYLPKYRHNMVEYPISIHSSNGFSSKYGAFLRNDILFTGYEAIQFGLLADVYTKRGFLLGPAANYSIQQGVIDMSGRLRSGYIRDHGDRMRDFLGEQIPQNRYFIDWAHQQDLGSRLHFTGQWKQWSDPDVVRDFRPELFGNDQDPDNFSELVYTGDNYYASIFTRFYPNDFQATQERLPEANFDLLAVKLFGSPVYGRGNINFVRLENHTPLFTGTTLRSNRIDGFYGMHMPLNWNDTVVFTPVVGGRITHYLDSGSNPGGFTRFRGQVGFDAEAHMYGLWDYDNRLWKINGLRHLITPKLQYRYMPSGKSGNSTAIPVIERHLFTTNLEPLDLGYLRDRDEPFDIHTVRLGLENRLQTRDAHYGSRDLAWLHVYNDARLASRVGDEQFSNIYTELGVAPVHWFNFTLYNRFNPENLNMEELRTRLTLVDGHKWQIDFATDNLANRTDQYYIQARWNLTDRKQVRGSWRYDGRTSTISEQVYSLFTQVGHAWLFEFRFTKLEGTSREDELKFGIFVDLLTVN